VSLTGGQRNGVTQRPPRDDPVPAGARQLPLEPFFTNS